MEALIPSIRAALEYADFFGGIGHELSLVTNDIVTRGATSEATQAAIDYLIQSGEVEEYTEPGGAEHLVGTPDGKWTIQVEPPSPALRLVGEAKILADKRNWVRITLQIQEAMPVPFLYVDQETYEMSKRSTVFPPPTADSMWWETRLWQRHQEIPFEQIRSGNWHGPLVLPFRVTYPWEKDIHDFNLPFRMTQTGRVCGFYEIACDYFLQPRTGSVYLVGRLPNDIIDILGVTAIDGIYLCGFINPTDDVSDKRSDGTSVARPQSPDGTPIPPIQPAENPETRSEQDHDQYIMIASFPSDETTADFIQSVLGQAGITCGMRGSRAYSIEVRESRKEQAIAILRKDSQRYNYRINFA